jgi:riboflavin biosynthesis pyrimidine reductase
MRALVDGVVIGVKTALHDAPRLTVRLCEGESPARIVIDPSGRLPDDSPVFREDAVRRLVIQSVPTKRLSGVEVIRLPATSGQIDPSQIVEALSEAGLPNLLIEGGNFTIAKFIEAGLLSRLHIAVSPIVIGSGPMGLTISYDSKNHDEVLRATSSRYLLGSEVVYDMGFGPEASEATKSVHG